MSRQRTWTYFKALTTTLGFAVVLMLLILNVSVPSLRKRMGRLIVLPKDHAAHAGFPFEAWVLKSKLLTENSNTLFLKVVFSSTYDPSERWLYIFPVGVRYGAFLTIQNGRGNAVWKAETRSVSASPFSWFNATVLALKVGSWRFEEEDDYSFLKIVIDESEATNLVSGEIKPLTLVLRYQITNDIPEIISPENLSEEKNGFYAYRWTAGYGSGYISTLEGKVLVKGTLDTFHLWTSDKLKGESLLLEELNDEEWFTGGGSGR